MVVIVVVVIIIIINNQHASVAFLDQVAQVARSSLLADAQFNLLTSKEKNYKNEVFLLPKELDEKVASLHLPVLGAEVTVLNSRFTPREFPDFDPCE